MKYLNTDDLIIEADRFEARQKVFRLLQQEEVDAEMERLGLAAEETTPDFTPQIMEAQKI